MKLMLAGSFGGAGQRRMLYASGATNVLLSAAHKNARESAELISGPEGKAALDLYIAGLGNGDDNWKMARSGGVQDLLCSYGHNTSRMTADHFAPRSRPDDMKLFIAGNWGPELQQDACEKAQEWNLLCTNAHKGAQECADHFASTQMGYHLLIDSGAFTAWRQGKPIVLADYIEYAKGMQAKAVCDIEFIGLDVIAGTYADRKAGKIPTTADLEEACRQGYENFEVMQAAGVPCIPTFHRDDPQPWLEKIARNSSRFCLAPRVDGSPREVKMRWLNNCFLQLAALNQVLNVERNENEFLWERWQIHGLGISSQEMMELYPFYSVDSTGWLWAAQNCALRYFNGEQIVCLQRANGWTESGDIVSELTLLAREKYRVASNHDFEGNILNELCNRDGCGRPPEEHGLPRDENCDAESGAYWFGKEAIKADVQLANHVTAVWQSRGVFFAGEDNPANVLPNGLWMHYNFKGRDGEDTEPGGVESSGQIHHSWD